jgi:glycosyltransferase involved in cell wall biosynthesis
MGEMSGHPLLLQVAPCYVDFARETNGVANIVRQICLGLARRGRRVLLACGNRELGRVKAREGRWQVGPGLEVQVIGQRAHPLLGPVGKLRSVLGEVSEPAVAHVHTCFSAFTEAAMLELQRRHIPYLFTPHGKLTGGMLGRTRWAKQVWWRLVAKRAVRGAGRLVVSSPAEAEELPRLGLRGDVPSVPNGFDLGDRDGVGAGQGPLIEGPYLLFLGYLDPRKQPEFLVRAFAASASRQTHRLVLAGPDAYGHRARVGAEIERLGIGDRVVLFGPAYGETKWRLLTGATCSCMPSRGEGLSVALCEALGAGVPLIISRACNFEAAARAGVALELAGDDVTAWAGAIDEVCLRQPVRQAMAKAARSFAEAFAWDRVVDRWLDIYDSAGTGAGPVGARNGFGGVHASGPV